MTLAGNVNLQGDAQAMYQLLRRASRERHVASTSANERSSRSHAVIQLALVGKCTVPGMQREVSGLLSFVDLAGSERLAQTSATGERLKEAQHINRSLCALGDVIEAICRKGALRGPAAAAVHVPSLGWQEKEDSRPSKSCWGVQPKQLDYQNCGFKP
eukprot:s376_g20.t1